MLKVISRIRQLRRLVKEIIPEVIDVCDFEGCLYIYFATLFTEYKYFTQIPSSGLDEIDTFGKHLVSYGISGRIFKSGYKRIRLSTKGHEANLPEKFLHKRLVEHLFSDLIGFLMYKAVRKAQNVYVLSNQVKWELKQLFNRDAIVLKGAYRRDIFDYKPQIDLRKKLNIGNKKIILSVCRLVPKKRVDWIIKAFGMLVREGLNDIVLIVGGTGQSADELKKLAIDLGVEKEVVFAGFIKEQELYDYYYHCDVFVSADYADFDITTYMAIAFDKNIVWTIDNELELALAQSGKIFPAELSPEGLCHSMLQALDRNSLMRKYNSFDYTWENYFGTMYGAI
jgi:glycosyltransferase involved in cell wall biosynthesis